MSRLLLRRFSRNSERTKIAEWSSRPPPNPKNDEAVVYKTYDNF